MAVFSVNAADYPTAPAWQLKNQAGDKISLNHYQGKPVILHFGQHGAPIVKNFSPN